MRWLFTLLFLCIGAVPAYSQSVNSIIGANVDCDPTIDSCLYFPLTPTILCSVNCTQLSAPSLTDPNRLWGTNLSNCRTSINGGVTWANCTTNPETLAILYHYAGTADGAVLAAGLISGSCHIRRSVDNAATWTTVFSDAAASNCGDGGANGGTRLKCAANGVCTLVYANTGTAQTVLSTDNGLTWTRTALTAISSIPLSLGFNGVDGFSTPGLSDGVSNFKGFIYGGAWILSPTWPSGTRCWPSTSEVLAASFCQINGLGQAYTRRSQAGAILDTVTIPDSITSANPGMIAITQGKGLWVVTNDNAGKIGVWATRDLTTSAFLVRIFTGPPAVTMTNQSDIFFANSCVYFSAGTGTPMVVKIC